MELLHNGAIGHVLVSKAWNSQKRSSIGKAKPSAPPTHLDFETWLGPAPKVPYQAEHAPWHLALVARVWHRRHGQRRCPRPRHRPLGPRCHNTPEPYSRTGRKYFFDDDQQFPDTQNVLFEYAQSAEDGRPRQLIFEQRIWAPYFEQGYENGNAFYGTNGFMLLASTAAGN